MKWWNEKWWWEFVLIFNSWISCRLELRCQNIHENKFKFWPKQHEHSMVSMSFRGLRLSCSACLRFPHFSMSVSIPSVVVSRFSGSRDYYWDECGDDVDTVHKSLRHSNKRQIAPEKFSVKAKVERKQSLNQPKWLCSFSWHSRARLSLRSHSKSLKFTCSLYLLDSTRKFSFNARQMGGRRPAAEAGNFALSTAPSDVDPLCIDSSTRRK